MYRYVLGSVYIDIFSGFFTASGTALIHRHRRKHVSAAISLSLSIFFFCHSWLLQSPVCFQPQLGTCVCVCVCVLTVHGHSARAGNGANTTENGPSPRLQNKEKTCFRILSDFMPFQQMTCHLHHLLRVCCGVQCACTVKTHALGLLLPPAPPLVVGTPSEPWCCAVLAA